MSESKKQERQINNRVTSKHYTEMLKAIGNDFHLQQYLLYMGYALNHMDKIRERAHSSDMRKFDKKTARRILTIIEGKMRNSLS